MRGYPDQALRRGQEALTLARALSHPASLAHARCLIGMLHQFRRDASEAQELAEALAHLSAEQGLPTYLEGGTALRGWAQADGEQVEEGLAQIRQALAALGTGARLWRIVFLALLAEVSGKGGKVEDGLAALAQALRVIEDTGMRFYEPEVHRLKGEFLLARTPKTPADAEACFRQAIALARRQGAKSWELRAVMSLSRLYQNQGKKEEARQMLAEVYGWFTEGFDTVDLREAKALLQDVG
jgi:predicted ATPase